MEWRSQEYIIILAAAQNRQCKNTNKVNSWSNNYCQFHNSVLLLFLNFKHDSYYKYQKYIFFPTLDQTFISVSPVLSEKEVKLL